LCSTTRTWIRGFEKDKQQVRRATHLAKSAFAHYPVEVEVIEADLTDEIDGVGWCTAHRI
jgi:hypothetical protein